MIDRFRYMIARYTGVLLFMKMHVVLSKIDYVWLPAGWVASAHV